MHIPLQTYIIRRLGTALTNIGERRLRQSLSPKVKEATRHHIEMIVRGDEIA